MSKAMNHFELFCLPVQFVIDMNHLSERFRALQTQFHPDKSATLSERDRLMAVQKSAEINDAYQTLRSPISRAEYLLFLNDLDIRHEQGTINDTEFLIQQMELHEQLEEIEDQANPSAQESALDAMEQQVDDLYNDCHKKLATQLDNQDWQQAAQTTRQLKFWAKLRQQVEQLADKLLD